MKEPILITGIERSGSSIVAKILQLSGAFTGSVTGMNENKNLGGLVSDYYKALEVDTKGQFPLPTISDLFIPTNWDKLCLHELQKDGYQDEPWIYKSSRIGQTYPVWARAFPDAKFIIVRRRTGDIIHSCLKTGFMTAFANIENQRTVGVDNERDGWLWWVHEHEKLFIEMVKILNCKIVWPDRMVNGDYSQMKELVEWVGLAWDDQKIRRAIEPMLNYSIQKERSK